MRITLQNGIFPKYGDSRVFFKASLAMAAAVVAAFVVLTLLVYAPSSLAADELLVKSDDTTALLPSAVSKVKTAKISTKTTKSVKAEPVVMKDTLVKDISAKPISANAQPFSTLPERFVWDKAPIPITLGVSTEMERRVTFPAQMFIGIPTELEHFLRVQTVDNTSYFTALGPFPPTRIIAEDRINGTVILLDMMAVPGDAPTAPVEISLVASQPVGGASGVPGEETEPVVDDAGLVRYAAKQLYAPRRLATSMPGVRRVYLDSAPVQGLYRGELVKATPIASWRGADRWVTAVMLQNESSRSIDLNPLALRGVWRAAVFQHGRLLPKGTDADTTSMYLISEHAFGDSH